MTTAVKHAVRVNHRTTTLYEGPSYVWVVNCRTCGFNSGLLVHRSDAVAIADRHVGGAER